MMGAGARATHLQHRCRLAYTTQVNLADLTGPDQEYCNRVLAVKDCEEPSPLWAQTPTELAFEQP